jgi:FtsP/CotA-like multicopper oxidase with cupredoxin domain
MNRRDFLSQGGAAVLGAAALPRLSWPARSEPDYTLRIAPVTLELAPGKTVRTLAYNGSVPGPVIRLREGVPVTIDVANDTDRDEFVHWHGLHVPADVDGAMEQGTPPVPAHGQRSYTFVPRPAGTRWYHSHAIAGKDFGRGTYSGQFGFLLVTPPNDPGRYDDEIFLTTHDWGPYIMGGDDGFQSVGYNHSTVNGRRLGFGEPIRVREGERVLARVLNASATDAHWLTLPGHRFTVIALDGNPVPTPTSVDQLLLNPGERVDAVIEMNQPGVWILGEPRDSVRDKGLGIVVEYAGRSGAPAWAKAASLRWSYLDFGRAAGGTSDDEVVRIPLVFKSVFKGHGAFEHWSINGKSFPDTDVISIENGTRYRLVFDNQSDEDHPVHLHRHSLEIVRMGSVTTSGILKDVVTVPAHTVVEADFTATNPGKTLFHCHLQDHMDAGFMTLFEYR